MLFCLKVAHKHVNLCCFHGKHFTRWDSGGMLETNNFVNPIAYGIFSFFNSPQKTQLG